MGSKQIQGELWGKRPEDWAAIQESTGNAGYTYVLKLLALHAGDHLLDVGCGSGLFATRAAATGAKITGFDASERLIEQAKQRYPAGEFLAGEMEELPFPGGSFNVLTGFNSFQYAASIKNALAEAHRVLKTEGRISAMIWGNKTDCEAATYLKAVGSLIPPPPPGSPGPFALSENRLLEHNLEEAGFTLIDQMDVDSVWDYPDTGTALKGLLSAGPVARAIDHSGYEKVHDSILAAVQPYIQSNGHVVYRNKFRIVTAVKK